MRKMKRKSFEKTLRMVYKILQDISNELSTVESGGIAVITFY